VTTVLMLGWEYPPHVTGGLAPATAGIVRGLLAAGLRVQLIVANAEGAAGAPHLTVHGVFGAGAPGGYEGSGEALYGMFGAVEQYAVAAAAIARTVRFDVIHAHDWLTEPAAMRIAAEHRRPWVLHVHATEYDRAGEHGNEGVMAVERAAVHSASEVIAVSAYTRDIVIRRYGADPRRVHVVHNSVERDAPWLADEDDDTPHRPMVLFLGRVTFQKGPDYFVEAARLVLQHEPEVLFVVAGDGDMRGRLMQHVAGLELGKSILFTGFVPPDDAARLLASADVFVMPSVSEPFGIAALEALRAGTPVILDRGAGVTEVARDVLLVDFWNVRQMADRILAALTYPTLRRELSARGRASVEKWSWERAGARITELYAPLLAGSR
jgi:glycosyltransferase involved in cell wall biosynthesis